MIAVSVLSTALSAAHGTETVITSRADFRDYREVPGWVTERHQYGDGWVGRAGTGTAGHVIGQHAVQDR